MVHLLVDLLKRKIIKQLQLQCCGLLVYTCFHVVVFFFILLFQIRSGLGGSRRGGGAGAGV